MCCCLDKCLSEMVVKFDFVYICYVDDLIFFSFGDSFWYICNVFWCIEFIVSYEGFIVNREKIRFFWGKFS